MPRTREIFINLGLLVGSLALFIGAGELALRLTGIEKGRVSPPQIYQKSENTDISYQLKPNMKERAFRSTVITDSHGFRSPEPDSSKPTIAVLGDSITFGYGVENNETLPARLNELLPQYNIINAAVPGYNLLQERTTYDTKVKPLSPDMLILVFYWNDLSDTFPIDLSDDGNLYPRGQAPKVMTCAPITEGLMGLIPGKCWLDTHSAVYRVLKKLVIQRTIKRDQAEQVEEFQNTPEYEWATDEQVQAYSAELTRLASLPPEMPKIFVIWPERVLHEALRPRIRQIAEEHGFKVVDLYETFGNNPETLGWDTVHPSAKTLKKAAEVIRKAL